jgi:hypothetical protein
MIPLQGCIIYYEGRYNMFIELKGEIFNLGKHSKISRYLMEFGAPSNQIHLWNGLTTQTYLEYGADREALDADWDFIKQSMNVFEFVPE